jgi:hypothetical protein
MVGVHIHDHDYSIDLFMYPVVDEQQTTFVTSYHAPSLELSTRAGDRRVGLV